MRDNTGAPEQPEAAQEPKAKQKKGARERTLIGVADSGILFVKGVKQVLVQAPNGQKVLYDETVDIPLKMTSSPIAGFTAGGGCAFTITEKWCKSKKLDYDATIESIMAQDAYGLRYVFEDDETKDFHGEPRYKRILDQIRYKHYLEKGVQAEAYETGIMHSESLI